MSQESFDCDVVGCDLCGKVIVFVPGLGADYRLFKYQTEYFSGSVAVDWIDPVSGETLEAYAVRMAAMIRTKLPSTIADNDIVICGLSLGGMIAPYIARNLNAAGYILLCSIRNPSQFPRRYYFDWFVVRGNVYFRVLRISFLRFFVRFFLLFRGCFGRFIVRDALDQIICMPARRFAELSRMMFDWAYRKRGQDKLDNDKFNNDNSNMPSIQIHGNRDMLLPIKLTKPDVIIEGGGHLLALTHPNQVNKIIKNFIEQKIIK
ncbi:MAG: alpha/beta hydrolase [Planctomycetaceae bacterium]|jgi:pimeloyl-ACP methyl ester carboxylesterase|nr:alpha/beta hydrolase [Planctomycetaceae bacterium]